MAFQEVLTDIAQNNKTLSEREAQIFWSKMIAYGRCTIELITNVQDQYLTLNDTTRDFFIKIFTNGTITANRANIWGSDVLDDFNFIETRDMIIRKLKPKRMIVNRDAKFFPYINTTTLDLSKYQIYNQTQAYQDETHKQREHCLIHTLELQGIVKSTTNAIKLAYVNGVNIRKKDLHRISHIIKRNINIYTMNGEKAVVQKIKTENAEGNDINIALYENHYFSYETTIYSKYSITNYDELKDKEDFIDIIRQREIKGKQYFTRDKVISKINSLALVDRLFKQSKFQKLDLVKFDETSSHHDIKEHIYLDNIENEQREYKQKEKKKDEDKPTVYYADCETFVKDVDYHKLYLLGCVGETSDFVNIYNVLDNRYKLEKENSLEVEEYSIEL